MKILIVSQHFWPESFRINDLAEELKKRGNEVSVLTAKPNYPQGKFYDGYSFFSHSRDFYKGITIYRVPIVPRKKGKSIQLTINYFSFVFFACIFILFHRKKYDVTLTFASSPITQMFPAILDKKINKSRAYLWVQDLWPESVTAAGKLRSKFALNILTKMVEYIYAASDKILVQSEAFISSIKKRGGQDGQIEYIPNWAEDIFISEKKYVPEKYKKIFPKGFNIVFAGNIGESQDFESILQAAFETKQLKEINWIILGDGRKRNWVENRISELGLEDTVHLLGRYPVEEMPYFFSLADIMLLSLKDEDIFSLTIPSKVQSYMASGKPILAMINGIGNDIIIKSNSGFTANAGDFKRLAQNAIHAFELPTEILIKKGINGKNYYIKEFSKHKTIDRLLRVFEE